MGLVKEDLDDVLKPKSYEEIKKDLPKLDVKKKKEILWEKAMEFYDDDYFLEFLEKLYHPNMDDIWERIIENIKTISINKHFFIDINLLKTRLKKDELLELILDVLSEKEIDEAIGKLWPEYWSYIRKELKEDLNDILKPKSNKEIRNIIKTKEDKENLLWVLGFPKFDDYEFFLGELERIFPNSNEIWMRLSSMANDYQGITSNERRKLRNNPKEFLFEWEPTSDILEYFIGVLTEKELNKAIDIILGIKLNEDMEAMKKFVKENLDDVEKEWEEKQEKDFEFEKRMRDWWKQEVHDYGASNLRDYNVDSVEELRNLAYDVLDRIEHEPVEGDVEEAMEILSGFVTFGPDFEEEEMYESFK